MGRKKKKYKPIIFCYYCDRTFENEKVLIQHQRAKHFKCTVCHKRLGSAHGMMVHVFQVHKQQIDKVPHAKEGRDSFHVDIFGMSNIPQEVMDEKHAERGEPPLKRQKLENQHNPLIINNGGLAQQRPPMMANPMMPPMNRMMMPPMNGMNPMNPMMMNPMMHPMMRPPMPPPPMGYPGHGHPMGMPPMPPMGMPGAMGMRPPMPMPMPPMGMGLRPPLGPGPFMPPRAPNGFPPQPRAPNPYAPPPHSAPSPRPTPPTQQAQQAQAPAQGQPLAPQPQQQTQMQPPPQAIGAAVEAKQGEVVPAVSVSVSVKESARAKKKNVLVYSEEMLSMEEQRFNSERYHWTPAADNGVNSNEQTVQDVQGKAQEDAVGAEQTAINH